MPTVLTPTTILAPASVDGRGGTATLNNSADANFVGHLYKSTGFGGWPGIRQSKDEVVEGPGAVFGTNQPTERPFTMEVAIARAATNALTEARYLKLCRAFDARGADGTLSWVDVDSLTKFVFFRLESGPSDPDEAAHTLVSGVCPDPLIYGGVPGTGHFSASSTSHTLNNVGNTDSPYIVVGIASPSATCTITNSTTGQSFIFSGTGFSGGAAIDFRAKTITDGPGTDKRSAITWPTSRWLTLAPGNNSLTCTNAMAVIFYDAWSSA